MVRTEQVVSMSAAPIGIIGGTGLEGFPELEVLERVVINTPYGRPSEDPIVATLNGCHVVYIPRHGTKHQLAPSRVPYKANLAALKQLGVKTVIGTCIAGSLKHDIVPGSFVVPDQFVNLTWGRDNDSIESNGDFFHLPMGEPYCGTLRAQMVATLKEMSVVTHGGGTIAVIQGPRFSTKAESRFFMNQGWDVVNMTQYPEALFARELRLCYAVTVSVTDWDVGVGSALSMHPDTMDEVLKIFRRNTEVTKDVLRGLVGRLQTMRCGCADTTVEEYYKRR